MKKLFLTTILLSVSLSSFALDIVTAPIQVFTKPCDNYRDEYGSALCYTQEFIYGYTHGSTDLVMLLVGLPFMILNENTGEIELKTQTLLDQGYSTEDIMRYKSDIELVERESEKEMISSQEATLSLLNRLKVNGELSEVTLEIMGI